MQIYFACLRVDRDRVVGEPEGGDGPVVDRQEEEGERVLREHHLVFLEASLSGDKDTLSAAPASSSCSSFPSPGESFCGARRPGFPGSDGSAGRPGPAGAGTPIIRPIFGVT